MAENKFGLEEEDSEEQRKYIWGRRSKIIYGIKLSILYHMRRERFLQLTDKFISAVTLATATAAVVVIVKKNEDLDLWVSASTAVLSLLPLIFDFAGKARQHQALTYEFRKLLAECTAKGEYWTEKDCDKYAEKSIEITVQESAPLSILVVDCQNRMAKEKGGVIYNIPRRKRILMHFFDMDVADLVEVKTDGGKK